MALPTLIKLLILVLSIFRIEGTVFSRCVLFVLCFPLGHPLRIILNSMSILLKLIEFGVILLPLESLLEHLLFVLASLRFSLSVPLGLLVTSLIIPISLGGGIIVLPFLLLLIVPIVLIAGRAFIEVIIWRTVSISIVVFRVEILGSLLEISFILLRILTILTTFVIRFLLARAGEFWVEMEKVVFIGKIAIKVVVSLPLLLISWFSTCSIPWIPSGRISVSTRIEAHFWIFSFLPQRIISLSHVFVGKNFVSIANLFELFGSFCVVTSLVRMILLRQFVICQFNFLGVCLRVNTQNFVTIRIFLVFQRWEGRKTTHLLWSSKHWWSSESLGSQLLSGKGL